MTQWRLAEEEEEEVEEGLGILCWQIVLIISLITTITFIKRITIHSSSISNLLEQSNKFSFEREPRTRQPSSKQS